MVVTRLHRRAFLTVRGPETSATPVDCPSDGDWVGVRFKLGTVWPAFLPGTLRDRRDVTLAEASTRSFWLSGSAWEYPTYENADTFVARLVHKGLIARDLVVENGARRRTSWSLGAVRPAALRPCDRHHLCCISDDRTRAVRDEPVTRGGSHHRCRTSGRILRPAAPHALVEIPDRADAVGGRTRDATVVVSSARMRSSTSGRSRKRSTGRRDSWSCTGSTGVGGKARPKCVG
jgi:hypothetical protein